MHSQAGESEAPCMADPAPKSGGCQGRHVLRAEGAENWREGQGPYLEGIEDAAAAALDRRQHGREEPLAEGLARAHIAGCLLRGRPPRRRLRLCWLQKRLTTFTSVSVEDGS